MAVTIAILMTHRVVVAVGVIVTAVSVVMWHSYSSRAILVMMARRKEAIPMVPQATLQIDTIFLVVIGNIVGSSAGLNFIVQLEMKSKENISSFLLISCNLPN